MARQTRRFANLRCSLAVLAIAAGIGGWATPEPATGGSLWSRDALLDGIGGWRRDLGEYGITLGLSETGEVLGNLTGGTRRGFEYAGLTTMSLGLDTGKALHWPGGTLFVSALQIHGRNLSSDHLAVVQTISNIDADRATRLWELWYQQRLGGAGADLRIGQQSIDQEFLVNEDGGVFLNALTGWPALPSNDLYAGAPVYPLSALGVRLRLRPNKALTVLAGVFDDNPPGGPFFADSQLRDGEASGTRFNLGTGALLIGELQYRLALPSLAAAGGPALPGTYKLGVWIDTARFPDQRFDIAGRSLADPAASGIARPHKGNFSVYGVVDQEVWRAADGGPRSLAVFARAMGAPSDRNPIDWSLNLGLSLKAPLPGRADDAFGIGYGWAHVGDRASGLDRDTRFFTDAAFPIRGAESVVEVTYRYQAALWWTVQPDLQYVIDPGGGVASPPAASRRVGDELVLGMRITITF